MNRFWELTNNDDEAQYVEYEDIEFQEIIRQRLEKIVGDNANIGALVLDSRRCSFHIFHNLSCSFATCSYSLLFPNARISFRV